MFKKENKTIVLVIAFILIFNMGFFLIGMSGDAYLVAIYPLYIAIVFVLFHNFKYRYPILHTIDPAHLSKEVKWGYRVIAILIVLCIFLTVFQLLAFGILLALYLFTAAFSFNCLYLSRYLKSIAI